MKLETNLIAIGILFALTTCHNKTEVIKLDLENLNSHFVVDYFMISNPPEDITELIHLVNRNLDTTMYKQKRNILKSEVYIQVYYKEQFFFDRTYKPHFKWYNPNVADDIRKGESHLENKYVSVTVKDDRYNDKSDPIMPFYFLYYKGLRYFPNGFRNDAYKHWELTKKYSY